MRSTIARFAMRRRGTVVAALILVLALTGTAIAGTGRNANLQLGVVNTVNGYLTTLKGAFTGTMFQVTNTGTGRGIGITVSAGKAPIYVNSTAGKATNLNADKVDGKNAADFLGVAAKAADADKLDGLDSTDLQRRVTGTCAPGSAVGSVGAAGAVTCNEGPPGPTGAKGLTWRGTWGSATAYVVDDAVEHQGSAYIAVASSTNVAPGTDPGAWQLLAAKGATGAPGTPGATGPAGPPGTPVSRPLPAPFDITAPDTTGDTGRYTSATIGADGLPIISYMSAANSGELKVAHCDNVACSSQTLRTVDSGIGMDTGPAHRSATSIAIGVDGLPIISYFDDINNDLKVAHCQDTTCTAAATTTVLEGATTSAGAYSSMTIGSDGFPIVSFEAGGDIHMRHCGDVACTTSQGILIRNGSNLGYTAITVGGDGFPLIAYTDPGARLVRVAHCTRVLCDGPDGIDFDTGYSAEGAVFVSMTTGADGLGVFTYAHLSGLDAGLSLRRCGNAACSTSTGLTIESDPDEQMNNSITVDPEGAPVVAYTAPVRSQTGSVLRRGLGIAQCADATCSSVRKVIVDATASGNTKRGWYPSVTIGIDGLPFVSSFELGTADLRVAHAPNDLLVPYFRRR